MAQDDEEKRPVDADPSPSNGSAEGDLEKQELCADDVPAQEIDTKPQTAEGSALEDEKPPQDPNVVGWDGDDDPANPLNWSIKKKWTNGGLLAAMTFLTYEIIHLPFFPLYAAITNCQKTPSLVYVCSRRRGCSTRIPLHEQPPRIFRRFSIRSRLLRRPAIRRPPLRNLRKSARLQWLKHLLSHLYNRMCCQ
jgi:hypothetical protein